tara:strand:+ start:304 stop:543 length:240 start_codon:yes stop_codon:yes gene_type:complete
MTNNHPSPFYGMYLFSSNGIAHHPIMNECMTVVFQCRKTTVNKEASAWRRKTSGKLTVNLLAPQLFVSALQLVIGNRRS